MKEQLIKILQDNITLTCHSGVDRMVVNWEEVAEKIHDYITDDGLTQIITPINMRAIRGKGEQSFIDGCDLDDIKESYPDKDYEKEIYVDGFWQGYLEAYWDTTKLDLPLQ